MNPIIQVRNLSKRYRIGTREQGYKTFREAVIDGVTAPFRNFAKLRRLTHFSDNGNDLTQNSKLKTQNSLSNGNESTQNSKLKIKNSPNPGDQSIQNSKLKTQNSPNASDTIWALKAGSFDAVPGEVVPISGRNGIMQTRLKKLRSLRCLL